MENQRFEEGKYYKHKNCMDAFIQIRTVVIQGNMKSIVWVDWLVQGMHNYWYTPTLPQYTFIQADQYDNWIPYEPKGNVL